MLDLSFLVPGGDGWGYYYAAELGREARVRMASLDDAGYTSYQDFCDRVPCQVYVPASGKRKGGWAWW